LGGEVLLGALFGATLARRVAAVLRVGLLEFLLMGLLGEEKLLEERPDLPPLALVGAILARREATLRIGLLGGVMGLPPLAVLVLMLGTVAMLARRAILFGVVLDGTTNDAPPDAIVVVVGG
jgi:hypothetical protein